MLDASEKNLAEAPAEERRAAETLAASWMATHLEQDLIPADEARRKAEEHRAGNTKEWRRSVYAALVGLRAVKTAV